MTTHEPSEPASLSPPTDAAKDPAKPLRLRLWPAVVIIVLQAAIIFLLPLAVPHPATLPPSHGSRFAGAR